MAPQLWLKYALFLPVCKMRRQRRNEEIHTYMRYYRSLGQPGLCVTRGP